MSTCPGCEREVSDKLAYCPECGQKLTSTWEPEEYDPLSDSLIGTTIARKFLIESVIGEGAMGRVYRATHIGLDRPVAVKVLHKHLAGDRIIARRFHREARAASRLNHPNSVQIIDFGGTKDGTLYIVMEYIEGRDLLEILEASFPLEVERIVTLIGQTLDALDEAHASGIVHRDLKPENIMILRRRDGREEVKVCDFGIAKIQNPGDSDTSAPITVAGIVCGTPEYMAPEQCRGEKLDGRADIYSVGVILYQLCTNDLPFTADSPLGVVTRQLTDKPKAPSEIEPDLEAVQMFEPVILKALVKNRKERYKNALELKSDLQRALAGELVPLVEETPIPTEPETVSEPPPEPAPVRRMPVIVASLASAVAVFLAAWFLLPALGRDAAPEITLAPEPTDPDSERLTVSPSSSSDAGLSVDASNLAHRTADGGLDGGNGGDAESSPLTDGGSTELAIDRPAPKRGPRVALKKHGSSPRATSKNGERPEPTKTTLVEAAPRPEKAPSEADESSPYELGQKAFASGNVSTAVQHFERARRANPGNAQVHFMLGRCYYRIGQTDRGRASYRRYLELRPNASNRAFIEEIIGQ